jgi:hypothetical protein
MKPLATVRTYDELNAALRARADALDISRETIDAISGLQNGYAGKLLAPIPIRTLSRVSLGAMLGALGLKLIVVEDVETLQKIEKRLAKRRRHDNAGSAMLATKRRKRRAFPRGNEHARLMRLRQIANQSPEKRSQIARRAALIRWGRKGGKQNAPKTIAAQAPSASAIDTPPKHGAISRARLKNSTATT